MRFVLFFGEDETIEVERSRHLIRVSWEESVKLYALIGVCIVLGLGCKKEPPVEPPKPATVTLKTEDASCTEARMKATITEVPATVRLQHGF